MRLFHAAPWLVGLAVAAAPVGFAAAQAGDTLQVGDRIQVDVAGDTNFSRTFTVGEGPALVLPGIGAVSVAGVRRAEVAAFLERELSKYLVHPVVQARTLVRLSILGEVTQPGFYPVPADATIGDALMLAGGPTRDAKMNAAQIDRSGERVWAGDALRDAIAAGRTVDALRLRSGDAIVIPRRRDSLASAQILGILVGVPVAILAAAQMF